MGWGEGGIIKVPTDEHYRLRVDQLAPCYERARTNGRQVIAVVGSACTTSTGSYDPLDAMADFCQQHQLWFHVDGAHGAPAALSSDYRHRVRGLERADSVTVDFHKMMLTPAITTGLVFKEEADSYRTFAQQASYLLNDEAGEWFNGGKRTFECTKRMMSVSVYAILRTYGPQIFEENVTCLYNLARTFAQMINERPALHLALEPEANIVCFRYVGEGIKRRGVERAQRTNSTGDARRWYVLYCADAATRDAVSAYNAYESVYDRNDT